MILTQSVARLQALRMFMLNFPFFGILDIRHWFNTGVENHEALMKGVSPVDLDIPACMGGHACFIPQFRLAGLKVVEASNMHRHIVLVPYFEGEIALHALQGFFGVKFEEACYMFSPNHYQPAELYNPLAGARRIEEVLSWLSPAKPSLPQPSAWRKFMLSINAMTNRETCEGICREPCELA